MDVHHEGNLARLQNEIPYLKQFIALLNAGIIGCCKRSYQPQRSGAPNIYKLESYKIDEHNLSITSNAASIHKLRVIHLVGPAVPTSACYHGYGQMGKRQTLEDKGEWLAIANYTLEENRPFALIAGPRWFRLGGRNRTVRDATGMSEWAEYGYVEKLLDPEGRQHKLTFTLKSTTADLMSRSPPQRVNFRVERTIETDFMMILADQFSLDLVLDSHHPFSVAQRSPEERVNVTESEGVSSR